MLPRVSFIAGCLRLRQFDLFDSTKIKEPFPMSHYAAMTLGFLLIFVGINLHLVDSYELTPRATKFYAERLQSPTTQTNLNNPLANNTYGNNYGSGTSGSNSQYNPQSNYGATGFNRLGRYPSNYEQGNQSPFQNAGYQSGSNVNNYLASYNRTTTQNAGNINIGPQKRITPPSWISWPVLFLGVVFVIHGVIRRRG